MRVMGAIVITSMFIGGSSIKDIMDIESSGELRFGAIHTEDSDGDKRYTTSLGGKVHIESKSIYGLNTGATFYTTNAIFGKDSEPMFLGSEEKSYSIVGEAYIKAHIAKTEIKGGRQLIDTPFIDSDDIGMIPNSIEGYTLFSEDIPNTTIILGSLQSWSGVDTDRPEKFTNMQSSKDNILMGGLIYKGLENITLQAWNYQLEDNNWNYIDIGYESDRFTIAGQYSNQGDGNSVFGVDGVLNIVDNISIHTAYNKTSGVISNGFGGGPFFTSSENHTIADIKDQEAILIAGEYTIDRLRLNLTHLNLNQGENETDYLASFAINKNHTLDLIYSDMYDDGNMVRFFANYKF